MSPATKRNLKTFAENSINLILISILTGLFSGVLVSLYNLFANMGEEYSRYVYSLVFERPYFVPLLLLALFAGALVIGTAVRAVPMIRGSGVPQITGVARGKVKHGWFTTLTAMFACSLACIFMGLPAGAEGPSVELGGCTGDAVSRLFKRREMTVRMQVACGAGAGFAAAFNAPMTGIVFVAEEVSRSFSVPLFISSSVAVVTATLTRTAIFSSMGMNTGAVFSQFVFPSTVAPTSVLWIALAALITSLIAVVFYKLVFLFKKLFKRVTFFKGAGKYALVFTAAGALALITPYAMGGGGEIIKALGSGGTGAAEVEQVFGTGFYGTAAIVFALRFVTALLLFGCSAPCGVFVPMLALGALSGGVLSQLFITGGMDAACADFAVIICMATFFTCTVKAPITGFCIIFELTGSFANFTPAVIGVAIGYIISCAFRLEPIYEKCLNLFVKEAERSGDPLPLKEDAPKGKM